MKLAKDELVEIGNCVDCALWRYAPTGTTTDQCVIGVNMFRGIFNDDPEHFGCIYFVKKPEAQDDNEG